MIRRFKSLLLVAIITALSITGFGATPSKPDFAFPQTVIKDSDGQLRAALRQNDGPATVRALMNWGLAQAAINPENIDTLMGRINQVKQQAKSPATKAMLQLVQARLEPDDSLFLSTLATYSEPLRSTPTRLWQSVVIADDACLPTLYDFATALAMASIAPSEALDSIIANNLSLNVNNKQTLFYFAYLRCGSCEDAIAAYRNFADSPLSAYFLSYAAQHSYNIKDSQKVFGLCNQWLTNFADNSLAAEVEQTKKYLTRPSVETVAPSIAPPGKAMSIRVRSDNLQQATVVIEMIMPSRRIVERIPVEFAGKDVFTDEKIVEFTPSDYGVYAIYPEFEGQTPSRQISSDSGSTTIVTSFLLSKTQFGGRSNVMALDAVNGALQDDVDIQRIERNRYQGTRGKDKYSPNIYSYSYSVEEDSTRNYSANILTDRAIYHPGDTVRFLATLMSSLRMSRRLDCGMPATVVLYNANHEKVEEMSLTSDDFGRISGEFVLPEGGLNGNYRLTVENRSTYRFMVSDYKAPTFLVAAKAQPLDSMQTMISGCVTGYNGFPVIGAKVTVELKEVMPGIWFRNYSAHAGATVDTISVNTDSQGVFSVIIPNNKSRNLYASIIAASPTGETHETTCFIPAKPYFISADIPAYVEAGRLPTIKVLNALGESVNRPVEVSVVSADSIVLHPDESWSNVPSGRYELRATSPEADTLRADFIFYRFNDPCPPVESALFVPETKLNSGEKLLIGTSYPDSHILYTLWTPDEILEQKWLTPQKGNFTLDVVLPEGVDLATLTLSTLRNCRAEVHNVRVARKTRLTNLIVGIESMRNHMTPGESETWTIKVSNNLLQPSRSAVVLDVYCKALDAIMPHSLLFRAPALYGYNFSQTIESSWPVSNYALKKITPASDPQISYPQFNLYGQFWPGRGMIDYVTNTRYMALAGKLESAEVTCDSGTEMEESADESSLEDDDEGVDDEYRLPEVPVALWQPLLTTDSDGQLQISFTAPNANTTWSVNVVAYDKGLLNGNFTGEIITSKPVMVQPQIPAFLRVGDSLELRAMVMNNTDSTMEITSSIELFNPIDNRVIQTADFVSLTDRHSSATIFQPISVPELTLIGIRVKSKAGNFADGEQSVIPVLPASVSVTTGKPLFLPSDSTSVTLEVPRGGVLTFTANAIWECIRALPGLQTAESTDALSLCSSLFSTATARGLLRSYPAIGVALSKWENDDSALVSQLEKNQDLKIALLSATPWVGASQSISERMARLSLLFNRKEIEQTIASDIDGLAKLIRDKGLSWTENSTEPSQWISLQFLQVVSRLRDLGYQPDNRRLSQIVSNVVGYLDGEVAREFAKDKNRYFLDYTLLRPQFPEVRQSGPAQRASSATVQYVVSHWRDFSLRELPVAALILSRNGYVNTAKQILESLRQRVAWRQTWLCPQMLDAFYAIEPQASEVNQIRNYFISQKQSTSWGSGPQVSNLIASIIRSGADWLIPAENQLKIVVDGVPVDAQSTSVLGEFRLNLPQGGEVSVVKGNYPAWGGVFSHSTDSIAEISAFESDKLKITQSISGEMKVGGKITVTIRIEALQPMDFVTVSMPKCTCLEPVQQLPNTMWAHGLPVYREPCSTQINWFFNRIAGGVTEIEETFYITSRGDFMMAPTNVQSMQAPEFQAHTRGQKIRI